MKNSALAILNAGLWADMAFFAADVGATGGGMRGLSLRGLVAWTGQTRVEYVIVGKDADGMPITRQVYAKEWVVPNLDALREFVAAC